ncbi:uncharacterized protein [Phaseolus vulgaris]|uniref:uncharacterized protein isoform X1 n=1 Tax=Phaseolus vulgaris TaxID=3885 RepID=UPI0035CCA1E8
MNLKNSKRTMRNGFMCPSEASTAVWSAVVPRKRHERSVSLDDTRLINCSNYSKIVDSATATFNSAHNSLSSANIQQRSQNQENGSTQLHKTPTDHVFQVVVMRVAIHCEGCAGKVKKHLSKMEDNIYNVRSDIIQCRCRVEEGDSDGIHFSGGSSSEHFKGQEG